MDFDDLDAAEEDTRTATPPVERKCAEPVPNGGSGQAAEPGKGSGGAGPGKAGAVHEDRASARGAAKAACADEGHLEATSSACSNGCGSGGSAERRATEVLPGGGAAAAKESAAGPGSAEERRVASEAPASEGGADVEDYQQFMAQRGGGVRVDEDFEKHRFEAMKRRAELKERGCKSLPPWRKFTKPEVERLANTTLDGEMYGLPVPPTLAELERLGAPWLTRAFHAAGSLPADNDVSEVVSFKRLPLTGEKAAGGAGPKAFLTVKYKKSDPSLHTELFVKMPWACDGQTKEMGTDPYYRFSLSCKNDYEAQEVTIYRFLGPLLPFKTPKYYFSDICRGNTNYILVTEKIPFGRKGKAAWEPYEVMPVAEKFFDFQLEPKMRHEIYYCLVRAQARMAAWDKLGYFDDVAPEMRGVGAELRPEHARAIWPLKLPARKREQMVNVNGKQLRNLWNEFLGDLGKQCYPSEHTDPKFVEAIANCCVDVVAFTPDIDTYLRWFPEMFAFQHSNLQSDNAYYWRNAQGDMDCGLFDWGGASPGNFAMRFCGCLTSADGAVLHEHEDGLIRCFIDTYYQECGIRLNFFEFRRQWWLAYCANLCHTGTNIEFEVFRETTREEWKEIYSLWHPKAAGRWNVRCFIFAIANAIQYLHLRWERTGRGRLHVHDAFLEWQGYWKARGMV